MSIVLDRSSTLALGNCLCRDMVILCQYVMGQRMLLSVKMSSL